MYWDGPRNRCCSRTGQFRTRRSGEVNRPSPKNRSFPVISGHRGVETGQSPLAKNRSIPVNSGHGGVERSVASGESWMKRGEIFRDADNFGHFRTPPASALAERRMT